ncbi:HAD family hydrolase [Amycolatopsis thailandensis]|uniref:HAD family hydrolase n=1 Tax=Amycolatopsis thailandensis TaxID=589330 RepID=UPI003635B6D8
MTAGAGKPGRHALLDVDGTLFPGVLGVHYLRDLARDGVCDVSAVEACLTVVERYATATARREQLLAESYRLYSAAIQGASHSQARKTAVKTWEACRDRLFPFAGELIDLLKRSGYLVHLISGNAETLIREAARDLGVSSGFGVRSEVVAGRFTGRLTGHPGLPGGKDAIVRALKETGGFDAESALAVGNTIRDAELFAHVGMAIAFEPDTELRSLSSDRGWHVVDRETIVPVCARLFADLIPSPIWPRSEQDERALPRT